ncbi:MAG TPA: diacylglycerol kinase family protein [Solirubrobacteraceae bacterium]|nr:diacylglycerol kinase family protein [Solirubrobacteraceae bacterium]
MSATGRPADLERLADALALTAPAKRRRMLVIVNPYASTVSDRLKGLVVHALAGRYEVDAVDTRARDHATALCREARDEGYDVVVAFGGDGTLNEAANGLAGGGVALTCLPGGATNVMCRMLGIPVDIVDATEHLLHLADRWAPRRMDLGWVDDRAFTFSAGLGLDAAVVERVDRHPRLKTRFGQWYYAQVALSTFTRRYLVRAPRMRVTHGGEEVEGVTTVVQNGEVLSYFGTRPLPVAQDVALDDGTLGAVVLRRASPIDIPSVMGRLFLPAPVAGHRQVTAWSKVTDLEVTSLDGGGIPLQVDGNHLGEVTRARFSVQPGGLTMVA